MISPLKIQLSECCQILQQTVNFSLLSETVLSSINSFLNQFNNVILEQCARHQKMSNSQIFLTLKNYRQFLQVCYVVDISNFFCSELLNSFDAKMAEIEKHCREKA